MDSLFFLGVALGRKINKMKGLKTLDFSKGHKCVEISKNMLDSLINISLEELNMSELHIIHIPDNIFSKVQSIKTLKMANNPSLNYDSKLVKIVAAMAKDSIQHVYFNNTGIRADLTSLVKALNGTHLKTLVVDNNHICQYEPILSQSLPKLEILSLAMNCLYMRTDLTLDMENITNLRGFNISWQHRIDDTKTPSGHTLEINKVKKLLTPDICGPHMACPLMLPPKMEWIDMSHFGMDLINIPEPLLMRNTTLNYWSMAYSGIQSIKFPFYCAWFNTSMQTVPKIQTLDYSGNSIGCINVNFFKHCDWSSLNEVIAKENKLRQSMQKDCNHRPVYYLDFLKPVWNLTRLDLSHNMVDSKSQLRQDSFSNQHKMQELYLSRMALTTWTVNISHMHQLRLLDISENRLTTLNKNSMHDMRHIEMVQKRKYGQVLLHVEMSGNDLHCTCESIDFLSFLETTNITFLHFDSYMCSTRDGKLIQMKYVTRIKENLLVSCNPLIWLYVAISVEITFFFCVILASLLRRYRHYLKFYYLGILSWIEKGRKPKLGKEYLFDAFVSYAETDKQWVLKRLVKNIEKGKNTKLCVANRDWIAGRLIMENIRNSLIYSRKAIFIISNSFLKSLWCLEEFSMALNVSACKSKYDH